jgi:hypothetical protein
MYGIWVEFELELAADKRNSPSKAFNDATFS